jgi:hypothetical protein
MSNPTSQAKSPFKPASITPLPTGKAAPTGAALDTLVDEILGRAAMRQAGLGVPDGDVAGARPNGLAELDVRLPPAAQASHVAHVAVAPGPVLNAALPPNAAPAPGVNIVDSLIDLEAGWLPSDPERRDVFIQVFRFWHARIDPKFATEATPAFLYLLTTLPVLIKARNDLEAQRLWEPKSETTHALREAHPAWKKYCEFLPRAQQASSEIKAYRTISLISGLDDLYKRVTAAEKKYRKA